jgi:anti-sigma factor RsiW
MREGTMSGHEHLSEDVLLDAVYGIAGIDAEAHLRACAECGRRFHEWQETRAAAAESVENPVEFLAAQRKKIYERIERPSRKQWLWAPGLAAACALAVGVFMYPSRPGSTHPAPTEPPDRRAEISDTQLFGDIYSMEQSLEPAAAAPVRALFEERQ